MTWLWQWLQYALGVWISPWPRCRDCERKARWSVYVDAGGADSSEFFFCDRHVVDTEIVGQALNLVTEERR